MMGSPRAPFMLSLATIPCLAIASDAIANGTWESRPSLVIDRQETGAARIGDSVYVVGGLVSGGGATNAVELYNVATNGPWSLAASMPSSLHHVAVAALGHKLYVMGGYTSSFNPVRTVSIYDAATNSWTAGPLLPTARAAAWSVPHQGKIYLFGGVSGGVATSDVLVLGPPYTTWSSAGSNMPTAREHLTAVSDGTFIYVIGGRASGVATAANERFDPATSQWQSLAPMPTARSATGTGFFEGRIYVAGGEVPMLHPVHEAYDIAVDTWTTLDAMPLPRHGVAAVALDDRVLYPGGGTVQGIGPTSTVDSFVPPVGLPLASNALLAGLAVLLLAGGAAALRSRPAASAAHDG